MIGVILVCSVMVYMVVPLFGLAGIYFNTAAKVKQKKAKITKTLKKVLEPLLPDHGLSWKDVEERNMWKPWLHRTAESHIALQSQHWRLHETS